MRMSLIRINEGFRPDSEADFEIFAKKTFPGDYYLAELRKPRNPKFHRKFFALLRFGFEHWEPGPIDIGGIEIVPEKAEAQFNCFRENILILAGHYDYLASVSGEKVVLQAKSISFGSMDESEFNELYNSVLNQIWNYVLLPLGTGDREKWEAALNEYEGTFA